MKRYKISVNNEYFQDISEEVYSSDIRDNGWYSYPKQMNKLIFGGSPKVIEGNINLKSYIDKILSAQSEGYLDIGELKIEVAE